MIYKDYSITEDEMKSIKQVEKAMNTAKKLGVHFWDDYGSLTAYNGLDIHTPVPDSSKGSLLNYSKVYSLRVSNFHAGNADDSLYVEFK